MLGRCVRSECWAPLAPLLTSHTVLYLIMWSRHSCWNKCSLAVKITLYISNTVELKKGALIRFIFLLIKLNLWLKRKLWLCQTEDMGMWGLGIAGIPTLIKLSFSNWILRCVLPHFCKANVLCLLSVFFSFFFFSSSQQLFSFTGVLFNGNTSNS